MVTTIQLSEQVKEELGKMKANSRETYEDVIVRLVKSVGEMEKSKEDLLKEGYLETAEESLKIDKEWSAIDPKWD